MTPTSITIGVPICWVQNIQLTCASPPPLGYPKQREREIVIYYHGEPNGYYQRAFLVIVDEKLTKDLDFISGNISVCNKTITENTV